MDAAQAFVRTLQLVLLPSLPSLLVNLADHVGAIYEVSDLNQVAHIFVSDPAFNKSELYVIIDVAGGAQPA